MHVVKKNWEVVSGRSMYKQYVFSDLWLGFWKYWGHEAKMCKGLIPNMMVHSVLKPLHIGIYNSDGEILDSVGKQLLV